jgi:hypothetical protein
MAFESPISPLVPFLFLNMAKNTLHFTQSQGNLDSMAPILNPTNSVYVTLIFSHLCIFLPGATFIWGFLYRLFNAFPFLLLCVLQMPRFKKKQWEEVSKNVAGIDSLLPCNAERLLFLQEVFLLPHTQLTSHIEVLLLQIIHWKLITKISENAPQLIQDCCQPGINL